MKRFLSAFVLVLASLLPSQDQGVNEVRVVNLATHDRYDVVTTVLPWKQGAYRGEPLRVQHGAVQGHQLGAAWPDGSHRYTRVHLPVKLKAGKLGDPTYYTAVVRRASATDRSSLRAFEFTEELHQGLLGLHLSVNGTRLVPTELLETGPQALSIKCRSRLGDSPLWATLIVSARSKCSHVRFWLHVGCSTPTDPATTFDVPEIKFVVNGAAVAVFHDRRLPGYSHTAGETHITLTHAAKWADGQSQMIAGRLLFDVNPAEQQIPVLAVATTWPESGAYGPFGVVPTPPVKITKRFLVDRVSADYRKHVDDPWAPSVHGLDRFPGRTGDQPPFGVVAHVLPANGFPSILYSIQRSVYQEACRPVFFREADGSMFEFRKHKNIHLWYRSVFRTSPDMLGKARAPGSKDFLHGFIGQDREHDVETCEQEYALLTGDLGALELRGCMIETALAAYNTKSGNPVIDGAGAPRSIGRGLQTLCWDYLLSGRDDVRRTIDARVRMIEQTWVGKDTGPLKFFQILGPDGRNLGGKMPFAFFWQDFIAIRGLAAAWHTTGNQGAYDVAMACGESLVPVLSATNGWDVPKNIGQPNAVWINGRWTGVGVMPMPVLGGPPVVEYFGGYKEWILPGVIWVGQHSKKAAVQEKARQFRAHVLSLYQSGPARFEAARLEKRWRVARWNAMR